MTIGQIQSRFPRAQLTLPGRDGPFVVDFIVDTGFDGELSLPPSLANRLDAEIAGRQTLSLADGTTLFSPYYRIMIDDWEGEARLTEVLLLDGQPLLGVNLLSGYLLQMEMTEGGEVAIDPL
jgi:clan AA aspartic protease